MSVPPLDDQARLFTESLAGTVLANAPACDPFRSRAIIKEDDHEASTVRQHPWGGIPLAVEGHVHLQADGLLGMLLRQPRQGSAPIVDAMAGEGQRPSRVPGAREEQSEDTSIGDRVTPPLRLRALPHTAFPLWDAVEYLGDDSDWLHRHLGLGHQTYGRLLAWQRGNAEMHRWPAAEREEQERRGRELLAVLVDEVAPLPVAYDFPA